MVSLCSLTVVRLQKQNGDGDQECERRKGCNEQTLQRLPITGRKHNQAQSMRCLQEQILLFSRLPERRLEWRPQDRVQGDSEENEEMSQIIFFI